MLSGAAVLPLPFGQGGRRKKEVTACLLNARTRICHRGWQEKATSNSMVAPLGIRPRVCVQARVQAIPSQRAPRRATPAAMCHVAPPSPSSMVTLQQWRHGVHHCLPGYFSAACPPGLWGGGGKFRALYVQTTEGRTHRLPYVHHRWRLKLRVEECLARIGSTRAGSAAKELELPERPFTDVLFAAMVEFDVYAAAMEFENQRRRSHPQHAPGVGGSRPRPPVHECKKREGQEAREALSPVACRQYEV